MPVYDLPQIGIPPNCTLSKGPFIHRPPMASGCSGCLWQRECYAWSALLDLYEGNKHAVSTTRGDDGGFAFLLAIAVLGDRAWPIRLQRICDILS